jgi:Flp pilus assembly protein TadD
MNTAMQAPSTEPVAAPMPTAPVNVESVLARATTYLDVGLVSAAKELYDALLTLDDFADFAPARHGLARCAFARGELHEALGHLQLLMQQDATNAEVNNDVGVVYFRLGLRERAREQLERAVMLDPNNMETRRNLIEACFVLDDLEACRRHALVEQGREPSAEVAEILEIIRSELG